MTGTSQETLAAALGERYAIERELARGGMATIYLARDATRGELVAVKLMDPKLARAVGVERFLREIEIVRSVTHPLVVPLYESGTAGELLYYIMPYIPGESLYERLERDRRLPLEDALQITHDVAAALGAAHGRGILHRDVKPENILVANGRALVADFGLARAIGSADYQKLTETGVIVGTVFYMSPEQLREDRNLDQRTDIYSLGCILYEMLTGEPPYTGPSLREVISRILRGPIPSARQLRPDVPAAVDQAISRAIAKSAGERFPSMQEFAAALPPPPVSPASVADRS